MDQKGWEGEAGGRSKFSDELFKVYKGKSKGGGKKHYVFGDLAGGGGQGEGGADPLNLEM